MKAYTQGQLEAAFDIVKSSTHWKDPIDKIITTPHLPGSLDLIYEAVIHFTGTVPTFTTLKDNRTRVRAVGYRNGPCGDF